MACSRIFLAWLLATLAGVGTAASQVSVGSRLILADDLVVSAAESAADAMVLLGDLQVDGTVRGLALTTFGSMTVAGVLAGDATVIGGDLRLLGEARVTGDVLVIGGQVVRDPGSTVTGAVTTIASAGWRSWAPWLGPAQGRSSGLARRLVGGTILVWLVLFLVLLGPEPIQTAADRAVGASWKSFAVGFSVAAAVLPLLATMTFALAASVVGIAFLPLVPALLLLFLIIALWGQAAGAVACGQRFRARPMAGRGGTLLRAAIGLAVLTAAPMVGFALRGFGGPWLTVGGTLELLGWLGMLGAWLTGLGAVILGMLPRAAWRFKRATTPSLP